MGDFSASSLFIPVLTASLTAESPLEAAASAPAPVRCCGSDQRSLGHRTRYPGMRRELGIRLDKVRLRLS